MLWIVSGILSWCGDADDADDADDDDGDDDFDGDYGDLFVVAVQIACRIYITRAKAFDVTDEVFVCGTKFPSTD